MNKITKRIKELKEQITLNIKPPDKCVGCGYTSEKMREEFGVAWLEHRIPNTNFVFYVCPNCNLCSGNMYAAENAKKIAQKQKEGQSRIVTPESKIILPGRN